MRSDILATCLFFCATFVLGGCPDDGNGDIEPSCDLAFSGSDISGDWELEASGTRTACSDRRLRGSLVITSAEPFHVTTDEVPFDGDASVADTFVNRIVERSEFDATGESLPAKLMFSGDTEGSCVSFELVERLAKGDELTYRFEGQISGEGFIEGNFTGTGPKDCDTYGSFTVRVR